MFKRSVIIALAIVILFFNFHFEFGKQLTITRLSTRKIIKRKWKL